MDFAAVPALTAVVYLIAYILKAVLPPESLRLLPPICGGVGGVLGVIVFLTLPGYLPVQNWLAALTIGIESGFAATGINQVYKQLTKSKLEQDDGEQ